MVERGLVRVEEEGVHVEGEGAGVVLGAEDSHGCPEVALREFGGFGQEGESEGVRRCWVGGGTVLVGEETKSTLCLLQMDGERRY